MNPFGITIWSKDGGGIAEIKRPGLYELKFSIPLSQSWVGKSATAFGWQMRVEKIVDSADKKTSTAFVRFGTPQTEPGRVNEAKLSPLQLNLALGVGFLAVASLFLVGVRYVFDSPAATLAIYAMIGIVVFILYRKYVQRK